MSDETQEEYQNRKTKETVEYCHAKIQQAQEECFQKQKTYLDILTGIEQAKGSRRFVLTEHEMQHMISRLEHERDTRKDVDTYHAKI